VTYSFQQLTDSYPQIGAKDITTDGANTLHLFNLFKAVAFVSVPFMANLPAVRTSLSTVSLSTLTHSLRQGVMVSLVTGVIAITAQSLILRAPSVRKALGIPRIPNNLRIKPPTFMETVKFGVDWFKNKNAEAQAQARTQQRKKF